MVYTCPLSLTQQFRFCPNPFRVDTFKGCDFNCSYCFANNRKFAKFGGGWDLTTPEILDSLFARAFERPAGEKMELEEELMRNMVPMHCGGMTDPFQNREWEAGITLHLIKLSVKYQYPIMFSTKADHLPQEYWDLLDPKLHAFQQSIIGYNEEFIRKYEPNTPLPADRLRFTKELHDKGFWTCIRIQPIIDLDEAELLIEHAKDIVDYIVVEHLKVSKTNDEMCKIFGVEAKPDTHYCPPHGAHWLVRPHIKKVNFARIAKLANKYGIKVGCGDNDAHELSQSRCCCGIDTIPSEKFSNYLKYNLTYFLTGTVTKEEAEKLYCPCSEMYMPFTGKEGYALKKNKRFKDWVDEYMNSPKTIELLKFAGKLDILQTLYNKSITKKLF